jgi:NAD(P)-dependent dehydrogenase (short-subunit alcohol dehydrogenase family)
MSINPFSLEGKTILITGASSGIGKQTAIQCSEMGANVIITGRNIDRLNQTYTELHGNANKLVVADLTEDYSKIVDILQNLDGIVHAAGIVNTLPFQFITSDVLNSIFQTNFFAPVMLTQQIVKRKLLNKNSSIVFVSSLAGIIASKGNGAYSASKSALNGMAKVMALELATKNIRVNTILPGMVKTEMMNTFLKTITTEQLAEDQKKYPLGYGSPEDVANAAIYLLSAASKWITGTSIILDGGFTLQ